MHKKTTLPPRYSLTGKGDEWYLERMIQDQWHPMSTSEEAIEIAWSDFNDEHEEASK